MLKISDYCDMKEFERIMSNWAKATGLATVAVGADGKYISDCYNFTDFCSKMTRGSKEGLRRCVKCDQEGHGVYHCHAGLIDFATDLIMNGEKVGSIVGGQVLPMPPDDEGFRRIAREIGVNEEEYLAAVHKVNVRSEECIKAAAGLLGQCINHFINASYAKRTTGEALTKGIKENVQLTSKIKSKMADLSEIQATLKVLAFNAKIEAVHAGEKGEGFSVVANEVRRLSDVSSEAYGEIDKLIAKMSENMQAMGHSR